MLLLFSYVGGIIQNCKYFGGFSADKIRRRLRRAEKFMADIRRTKIRRRIRRAAPAEGSGII
jgi:hypothetical protein